MKAIEAWNVIIKRLSGKSEKFTSKRRLKTLPIEFTAFSDGINLILAVPFKGKVIIRLRDFEKIYPQYFTPTFNRSENVQKTVDCVCTVIDKCCINHNLKNNLNGSAQI